jgi:signal peptidase I
MDELNIAPIPAEEEAPAVEPSLVSAGPGAAPPADPAGQPPAGPPHPVAEQIRRHGDKYTESWMGIIQWLASTVAVAVFIITFVAQAFEIPSQSMENTLLIGDYLLVDKSHYGEGGLWQHLLPYTEVRRGDIIVFNYPLRPTQHFVKRVIAIPGDHLVLFHGRVFVNGKLLDDGQYAVHKSGVYQSYRDDFPFGRVGPEVDAKWYAALRQNIREGQLLVPPGEYFVMGDNRDDSYDSRYWGFVPRENIVGRPLMIYLSVRQPVEWGAAPDDRLQSLLYSIVHLPDNARWDRTLRLVR